MGNKYENKGKALVIDNSMTNFFLVEAMLQQYGLAVCIEQSAMGVLEKIEDMAPDLIFLDYMMPGMNGLEALELIKKQFEMPVVMISAYNDKALIKKALNLGAADFLVKPFTLNEVFTCCDKLLNNL